MGEQNSGSIGKCTPYVLFLAFGMLITGTVNTLLSKIIYEYGEAPGCCGWTVNATPNNEPHFFRHPWFQTWIMFLGEMLCVFPFIIKRQMAKSNSSRMYDKISERKGNENPRAPSPFSYIFAIPAACDLTASTLGSIALLWIPASIWQMMRGANIIFTGILSIFFLEAKLSAQKWFGMFLVVCGLVLVGLSGFLTDDHHTDDGNNALLFIVGILLVLGAQLIAATQFIVEEKLLKGSGFEPLNVVFMEGFWGWTILTLFALPLVFSLPGQTPIRAEQRANFSIDPVIQIYSDNFLDAMTQMYNRYQFGLLNVGTLLSIAFFNFFGLTITTKLTSVHRMLIDACRTMFVWGAQIFFGFLNLPFGEHLSYYSFIQLGGFVLLVSGTLIYNEVIVLCKTGEDEKKLLN